MRVIRDGYVLFLFFFFLSFASTQPPSTNARRVRDVIFFFEIKVIKTSRWGGNAERERKKMVFAYRSFVFFTVSVRSRFPRDIN